MIKQIWRWLTVILLISGSSTAAWAYDSNIFNDVGTGATPNPVNIARGTSAILSYHAENVIAIAINTDFAYSYKVVALGGGAAVGDITVTLPANFHPTAATFTDIGAINIALSASAPIGATYIVTIKAGDENTGIDFGSASRNVEVIQAETQLIPLAGDLDGDGVDSYGTFDINTASFNFDGKTVYYGLPATDLPIIGDWDNDGKDEIGIFRPNDGGLSKLHLVIRDWSTLSSGAGSSDYTISLGGSYPNNIPISGNWDGIGGDDYGGFNPATNTFYLYTLNLGTSSASRYMDVPYGITGDKPISGDWNGDGKDEIGIFRPLAPNPYTNSFYLDLGLTGDQHEMGPYELGNVGDEPLIGDWDGNGFDNLGVYRPIENGFYPRVDLPATPAQYPDLIVTEMNTPDIVSGEFFFSFTVKNQGKAQAEGIGINLYWYDTIYISTDTNLDASDTYWATTIVGKPIVPILPGGSYVRTGSLRNLPVGDYYIIIETDGFKYVDESNENNNIIARHIIVKSKDASITLNSPNGGENWQAGTTQTIQWTYTGSPGDFVDIHLLKNGVVVEGVGACVFTSEKSFPLSIPLTQIFGIDYQVRITSTTNSAYTDTSDVNFAIALPDLIVTDIKFSKDNPAEGEPVTITATIKNIGNIDAKGLIYTFFAQESSYTGFEDGNGNISIINAPSENMIIKPGETHFVETIWNAAPIKSDNPDGPISVRVDFGNNIAESNENNNKKYGNIIVEKHSTFLIDESGYHFKNFPPIPNEIDEMKTDIEFHILDYSLFKLYDITSDLKKGVCYGMAATSILYYEDVQLKYKPVNTDTFIMSKNDNGVVHNIIKYQSQGYLYILNVLFNDMVLLNLGYFDAEREYNIIANSIKDDKPIILGIKLKGVGNHALTAYNTYDVSDSIKNVVVYDSNHPGMARVMQFDLT